MLGDSGFLLYTPSTSSAAPRLSARSAPLRHRSGTPYQLVGGRTADCSDPPSAGVATSLPLIAGSVLLLHTDGLLDNLSLDEVATIVARVAGRGGGGGGGGGGGARRLAQQLANEARARRRKPDDVTVVVCLIDDRDALPISVSRGGLLLAAVGALGLAAAVASNLPMLDPTFP